MLVAAWFDSLLGIAAIITAIGGGAASIYTVISSKREVTQKEKDAERRSAVECYEKLLDAQREAETISESLHEMRMKAYEDDETTH